MKTQCCEEANAAQPTYIYTRIVVIGSLRPHANIIVLSAYHRVPPAAPGEYIAIMVVVDFFYIQSCLGSIDMSATTTVTDGNRFTQAQQFWKTATCPKNGFTKSGWRGSTATVFQCRWAYIREKETAASSCTTTAATPSSASCSAQVS